MGLEDLKFKIPSAPQQGLQKNVIEEKKQPVDLQTSVKKEERTYTLESLSPIAKKALEKNLCISCELFTNKLRLRTENMGLNPATDLDHNLIIQAFKFENMRRDGVKKDWPKGSLLCDPLVAQINKKSARIQLAKAQKKENENA